MTAARAWVPLRSEVEPAIAAVQPSGFQMPKASNDGWIGPVHSPIREEKNPSFSFKLDSGTEAGGWVDHGTGERGSIADLAKLLGIDPNRSPKIQPVSKSSPPELTLNEFCLRRHLQHEPVKYRWRARQVSVNGRPALQFPTTVGIDRLKFLDDEKPKIRWAVKGGHAHWYGWAEACEVGGPVLVITNGEVSVWAAHQAGVAAVCTCGGEGCTPNAKMIAELRDGPFERFAVVFDLDDEGRSGARVMVDALRNAGFEATALELPSNLGPGGDLDDLHRKVGDAKLADALVDLPELNLETVDCATPRNETPTDPIQKPQGGAHLVGVRLSDVDVTQPIEWLWKGWIPRNGAMTIFDGPPDVGKSTLVSDLAARITTGRPMPDGSPGLEGGVVIVTSEAAQQVTARQIEVAGGDRSRVHLVATVGKGLEERPISLPADLPLLRPVLAEVGAVALILDPLLEVIGGSQTDTYKDGDVRRCLTPVRRLCEELNLALIGIRHPTKAGGGTAMYKGGGSVAFVAVARAAYYVARDPGDPDLRVIANTKCNLGPRPRSVAYRLEVVRDLKDVKGAEDDLGVCRVDWVGYIDRSAQELADSPESLSPEQQGVVNALSEGCSSIGEVSAYTGRSYTACSNNLGRLVKLKHVRKVKTGSYELTGSLAKPSIIPFTAPPSPPVNNVSTVKEEEGLQGLQGLQGGRELQGGGEETTLEPPW